MCSCRCKDLEGADDYAQASVHSITCLATVRRGILPRKMIHAPLESLAKESSDEQVSSDEFSASLGYEVSGLLSLAGFASIVQCM